MPLFLFRCVESELNPSLSLTCVELESNRHHLSSIVTFCSQKWHYFASIHGIRVYSVISFLHLSPFAPRGDIILHKFVQTKSSHNHLSAFVAFCFKNMPLSCLDALNQSRTSHYFCHESSQSQIRHYILNLQPLASKTWRYQASMRRIKVKSISIFQQLYPLAPKSDMSLPQCVESQSNTSLFLSNCSLLLPMRQVRVNLSLSFVFIAFCPQNMTLFTLMYPGRARCIIVLIVLPFDKKWHYLASMHQRSQSANIAFVYPYLPPKMTISRLEPSN